MAHKDTTRRAAGYSGTPLPRKLGIKPGHRVAILNAPPDFDAGFVELFDHVKIAKSLRGTANFDVVLLFCRKMADLQRNFEKSRTRLAQTGGLWIAWPKKASGVPTDLGDAVVREFGLAAGLVDNKVCAVDETWSALRFVIRLKDRK